MSASGYSELEPSGMPEEAIFRSADMTYVELYIPSEVSREIVCILGNLGAIMLKDMNSGVSAFQRSHVDQIRRYDEVDRLVQYLVSVSNRHADATLEIHVSSCECRRSVGGESGDVYEEHFEEFGPADDRICG